MSDFPIVSIITPSFNQVRFIEETILSVLGQTYPHIEYIVIDGGSTDGTLAILEQYKMHFNHFISATDNGQADAINQGFKLASGEILAWLNADDLLDPEAVSLVVSYLRKYPLSQFVYGDAIAIDHRGRSFGKRVNVAACDFESLVHLGDFIVQPAAFWRRSVFEEIGGLDDNLLYTLDYEYWMRIANYTTLDYLPQVLAYERLHGSTKTSVGGLERINELAQITYQFNGDGIPYLFRPEAAAVYTLAMLNQLIWGRWHHVSIYYQQARKLNNHNIKYALHLIALSVLGGQGTMLLRLWSNWLRNQKWWNYRAQQIKAINAKRLSH